MDRYHVHSRLSDPEEADVMITTSFDATSLREAWNRWRDLVHDDSTFISLENPDGQEYSYPVLVSMFGER